MKTKVLIFFSLTLMVLAWNVPGSNAQGLPSMLHIGTHAVGSFGNIIGTGTATILNKYTPMKATVKAMAGPSAWYPLVVSEEVDLGVANNWDSEKGYLGQSVYEKLSQGKGFPIRLMTIGVAYAGGLVVAADSGIYSYADLRGKRVAGNLPTPSLQLQTEAYVANGGVKWSEVKVIPVSNVAEGVKAVIEGRADCSATITLGMPVINELHAKKGARILPIDPSPEAVKRTKDIYPGYPLKVTPGPGRTGVDKEMYLWGYDIYLVGRQSLSDEAAYQIVRAMWEHYAEMGQIHVLLKEWTPDKYVSKEALIPYHPGAIRFYKEKGVWTTEMEKLQEVLLAKKK